jgi:tripartite-type tricarboxylate transporter receptor subunit TctC
VGAGGAIAFGELARSKPDGYTLCGINLASIIVQPLVQPTGYQTDHLVPVMLSDSTPLGLAVLKTSRYRTLQEVLDAAKAKPGEITSGVASVFGGPHMAALWLEN